MYTVNIILKNSPVALSFMFKAFKAADDLYCKVQKCTTPKIELEDEYDTKTSISMDCVAAVSVSDFSKDMDKNGEMSIIQHKSQLKAQNLAKNDVGLALLNRAAVNGNPNTFQ